MLLTERDTLDVADFGMLSGKGGAGGQFELPAAGVDLEDVERSLVVQALERSGHNQTRAAALLGLNRDQIRYRIEKFGLARA
jgi:transcriptional regulator with GAF, ATPase, and Fis domain